MRPLVVKRQNSPATEHDELFRLCDHEARTQGESRSLTSCHRAGASTCLPQPRIEGPSSARSAEQAGDGRAACAGTSAPSQSCGALMPAYSTRRADADKPYPVLSRLGGGAAHAIPRARLVGWSWARDG